MLRMHGNDGFTAGGERPSQAGAKTDGALQARRKCESMMKVRVAGIASRSEEAESWGSLVEWFKQSWVAGAGNELEGSGMLQPVSMGPRGPRAQGGKTCSRVTIPGYS